jgi:hypothetical protein
VRTIRIGALQNLGRHIAATEELRELLSSARSTDNLTAILQMTFVQTAMEQLLGSQSTRRAQRAGDPEPSIRQDLSWLSNKALAPLRAPARARLLARLAYLRGNSVKAVERFRESIEEHTKLAAMDEVAREQYALGCLLGGDEGAQIKSRALEALLVLGVSEPEADLRAYYPELFRRDV